jgi:predicted chitinase
MRAHEFLLEAELDPSGWGQTPYGSNVDYQGLKVKMRPSTFLKLSNPLTAGTENPKVAQHMLAGGKIAYPFLEIKDPDEWEQGDFSRPAKVVGHEGRNRMTQWIKMKGDEPIQVNLFLRNANRRRYITDEMIQELSRGLISEWGYYITDVFDANTALEEDWRKWAAGAAVAGAGALGGYQAMKQPVQPVTQPIVQPAPELPVKKLKPLERVLVAAAQQAGLQGNELKQFLAQCAHETGNFTHLEEIGSDRYFMKKYDKKYNPRKAKELGNVQPGDGIKYKGRGFIQLTGRYNYKRAGQALGLPLEANPELVERPDIAARVSLWFWAQRVQPKVVDFHNVPQSTKPINPALKGLASRQQHYNQYQQSSLPK